MISSFLHFFVYDDFVVMFCQLNEWALCKIYENRRNKKRDGDHQQRSEGLHVHDVNLWMGDPKKEDENEDGSLKEEYFDKELPPGYRFEPTEEELVTYYLMRKASTQPLPRHKIRQVNVYEDSPQELTGYISTHQSSFFVF